MTRPGLPNFLLFLLVCLIPAGCEDLDPVDFRPAFRIGVMLPFTGTYASCWDDALDWAVQNINLAGGVAGHDIKLVKKDLGSEDVMKVARRFINDNNIKAVIGPLTSRDVFNVAPDFIKAKKILIAPVATAANISRAFAGKDYFWRLCEPDISQAKTLLLLARSGGAHSVALITEESDYGDSFEDWFGFFATELGLEITGIRIIDPDDAAAAAQGWNDMAATHPDAILSALNLPELNQSLVRAYRTNGQQIRLLMSDAACLPSLIESLGPLAENLEGTNVSANPKYGFDIAYHARYGAFPEAFLANVYDAVMLIALALEASGGEGGEALAEALKKIVSGREGESWWQRDDLAETISLIAEGIYPDLCGTSGSLDFDDLYYTDVTSTTYGHWRVDAGQFVVTRFYTSDGSGRISSTSAAYRTIAEKRQQFSETGNWPEVADRTGLCAFLMATSSGWSNYRHQADVLSTYQILRSNSLSDERIILILADDIAGSPSNPLPGIVRNEPGGENLYKDVKIDYNLRDISSDKILRILTGESSGDLPAVLPSTPSDNVLIFTSGHGNPDGMILEGEQFESLTPEFWAFVFEKMHQKNNFRLIFWALESCYSGKIGLAATEPGILLMTAANPYETSKADQYDPELKSWLADRFAFLVNSTFSSEPHITFDLLYEKGFSYVNGSHVSFYNYQHFGNIYEISLSEFIKP